MTTKTTRRSFLKQSSLAASASLAAPYVSLAKGSANSKLNVGFIGVANRAGANLKGVSDVKEHVHVAALCDIDDAYLAKAAATHKGAKTYHDFRKLIEQKDLDAIVVGTPDHTHAVAAVAADPASARAAGPRAPRRAARRRGRGPKAAPGLLPRLLPAAREQRQAAPARRL